MSRNKGFTLIEMAVVLGIIAILAAILTPVAITYIDQARITRAESDVRAIAKAYQLFYRDTSVFPIYNLRTSTSPSMNCQLTGTGTSAVPSGSQSNWTGSLGCSTSSIQLMRSLLNINSYNLSTNPTAGALAFRGPYLDGAETNDPWGTPYFVNSKALDLSNNRWAIAISAGPNLILDTDPWQARTAAFAVSGDDIAEVIR